MAQVLECASIYSITPLAKVSTFVGVRNLKILDQIWNRRLQDCMHVRVDNFPGQGAGISGLEDR